MQDPHWPNRRRFVLGALASLTAGTTYARSLPPHTTVSPELTILAGRCVLAGFHRRMGIPPVLYARLSVGGLAGILVGPGNFSTLNDLRALTASVQSSLPHGVPPALVAADQEGGTVSHLSPPLPFLPAMASLGRIDDIELTRRVGAALGTTLRSVGCTLDLAPVLDVRTCVDNLVDLNRAFGRRPDVVSRHGVALSAGLASAGVLACAKHFPGHGDTREDSHIELPRLPHNRARLDAVELVPFRAAIHLVPAVMLAHVVYAGVDPTLPASLSPAILQGILRDALNFTGVAVSDDLEMAPIRQRYGVPAAAVRAIEAGCDLVVIAHTPSEALAAIDALATAAQQRPGFRARLTEAASRVDTLRARLVHALPPNPYAESPTTLLREVIARNPTQHPTRGPDPTLRR